MDSINSRIAEELGVRPQQVEAAVALLDEGSTVPFIARYRKEVTGSLDDTQLRHLEERLRYLRELDERRISILASIEEQGKLTPQLERDIKLADTKTRLEDLYLPYKQKRRTKGQIALEAGLGDLADGLFNDPSLTPETEAARFIDAEINSNRGWGAIGQRRCPVLLRQVFRPGTRPLRPPTCDDRHGSPDRCTARHRQTRLGYS